jgi:hypothetical protein
MTSGKIEDENRMVQGAIMSEIWSKIELKISGELGQLTEILKNEESKKKLAASFQDLEQEFNTLMENASKSGDERKDFNKFIKGLKEDFFENLMDAIKMDLSLPVGEYTIDRFFDNFFNYLSYKVMLKVYPKEYLTRKAQEMGLKKSDFFIKMDTNKWEMWGKIENFLKKKRKNCAKGYTGIISPLMAPLRNVATHRPSCYTNDYIYHEIEDYGNSFISCNIMPLICYAYLEILTCWRKFR